MLRASALLLCSALALSACASGGKYPSLARRDAERISGSVEPVTPQIPAIPDTPPPSAELQARLAALVDQGRAAHRHFSDNRRRTERLVAAANGAAIASENWSVASVALADLDAARSEAMIALAELDMLYAAERIDHFESESRIAKTIGEARDQVGEWVEEEDLVLTELRGRLPE